MNNTNIIKLSRDAEEFALKYGGLDFLDFIYNSFIPKLKMRNRTLRNDWPGNHEKNIINTAWSLYNSPKYYPNITSNNEGN